MRTVKRCRCNQMKTVKILVNHILGGQSKRA